MYKTKLYYESDVRDTVMILYVICQLMCVTNPWAHTSFVHSILSLKLGVTATTCSQFFFPSQLLNSFIILYMSLPCIASDQSIGYICSWSLVLLLNVVLRITTTIVKISMDQSRVRFDHRRVPRCCTVILL